MAIKITAVENLRQRAEKLRKKGNFHAATLLDLIANRGEEPAAAYLSLLKK